jgi:hypothetical protein
VVIVAERKPILLRLDPAVHDALARWAADELRSTNAQIEMVLRRALAEAGRAPARVAPLRGPGRPRKGNGGATSADAPPDDSGTAGGSGRSTGAAAPADARALGD